MASFLENVGILAIAFLIIHIYKKILEWHDYRHLGFYEDEKVYKAAEEFVHGASSDHVKAILAGCFDLNEGDVKKILSQSISHRADKDRGYRTFIMSVNKVLGEDVYDEKRRAHETGR